MNVTMRRGLILTLAWICIILMLAGFVAVTWMAAVFSHDTNGQFVAQTFMLAVPAYMFIGLGLAFGLMVVCG
jgi:hypothetical protein